MKLIWPRIALLLVIIGYVAGDEKLGESLPLLWSDSTFEDSPVVDNRRKLQRIRVVGRDPPDHLLPLGHCRGDCDNDKDCADDLICFQRTLFATVPGCSGGSSDGSFSDYCVRRRDAVYTNVAPKRAVQTPATSSEKLGAFPTIRNVGNNIFAQGRYPLEACEGDCDNNQDCEGGLVCQQRDSHEAVFGCQGGSADSSSQDYCVRPDAVLHPNEVPTLPYTSKPFRLKLYWEQGYRWQEESLERKWCMMYNYRNRQCWHGLRSGPCDQDAIYISKCDNNEARQQFAFIHLEGGSEVMVRIGSGSNSCFQRDGRSIVLRQCNSNTPQQQWYAPNGSLQGYRFELSQTSYKGQCVTQAHHPKEGEIVELHSCRSSRNRNHQSSYWNVY